MSKPVLLQDKFTGIYRDRSIEDLPEGKVWDSVNFIPDELGAPLSKRGGWSYQSLALTSADASAGVPARVIVAPFSGGTQVLVIDDRSNCEVFDVTAGGAVADLGSLYGQSGVSLGPHGQPVFYRGGGVEMVIFPTAAQDNATTPRKMIAAGTISALGGSPPDFCNPVVYKDRLVVQEWVTQKIFFSGAGDAESWDTTNRFINTSATIKGLAPLKNALLVFHAGTVERIRGDIPPGSAAANMTLEPLFSDVGLIDPDALAVSDEYAYWADENGVYRTDGTGITDLTKQGGISDYWRGQIDSSTASISLAVWRGYVWISILETSDVFEDFLVYNIDKRYWFRFSNIRGYNFAVQSGTTDELYFSNRDTSQKRVGSLSSVFSPSAATKNDPDGDAVIPTVQCGFLNLGSRGKKRWKRGYLSYSLHDAASDDPTVTLKFFTDVEDTPDSFVEAGPFPETNIALDPGMSRKSGQVGRSAYAVAPNVGQTAASELTRVFAIEADVFELEGSRR